MSVLALDLGTRRIGVAVSGAARMAFPRPLIPRSKDRSHDHRAIAALVEEEGATTVVVGLPLGLNGRDGAAAESVRSEVAELETVLEGVTVTLVDERLTTVTAERALTEAGKRGSDRRASIDSAAAVVILETWLAGAESSGT